MLRSARGYLQFFVMNFAYSTLLDYQFFLKIVTPSIAVITTRARNIKNNTLATDVAPAAMPVKPKIAAIIAITKKIAAHFNIVMRFKLLDILYGIRFQGSRTKPIP
jgi:hypothetical protein